MIPPVVSIVGSSGSGKTTLLEKVIRELTGRGLRVGVLKHDAHGFTIDHEGKDSWRYKQAGAVTVALSSPDKYAVIKDVKDETDPARLISLYLSDADVVLIEGYKRVRFPKIEVLREANAKEPVCTGDELLIGYASDYDIDTPLPVFGLDDFKGVTGLIDESVIRPHRRETVSLVVDGRYVPLKPFIEDLIREAVTGMIKSLKGCGDAEEVELRVVRK